MSLTEEMKSLLKYVEEHKPSLKHNHQLFEIYEGDLIQFIQADLKTQLSEQSYDQIKHRIAPINILVRLVDKLSKIYAKPPTREIIDGTDKDEELLAFYVEHMGLNQSMNSANELFNLHKSVSIEPFVDQGYPQVRNIPADRFLYMSNDPVNPLRPTHWIKVMGEVTKTDTRGEKKTVEVYYVYTDKTFVAFDSDGDVLKDLMLSLDNPDGINPYGKIPSVFVNKSFFDIVPTPDSDTLRMTRLIPLLLTDLNGAVMFQAFSIFYGIDVTQENLTMAPNAFWNLKSDQTSETKPEIGTIKPEVDIDQVLNLIQAELVLWLNSKNINPGTVGTLNVQNAASGISKIIDEADTAEDRTAQVPFFENAEADMWDLIINYQHPYWMNQKMIDTNLQWTPGVKIKTIFTEQLPMVKKADLIKQVIEEINAGLTTKERAIRVLNPGMSEKEIEELLAEIAQDNVIEVPDMQEEPVVEEEVEEEEEVEQE